MEFSNYVIVGAGGIGAHLAPVLSKFLAFKKPGSNLWIIDGDEIEDKNLARVYSNDVIGAPKATILQEICSDAVPSDALEVETILEYVTPDTFERYHKTSWYKDGTVIFACVDNHKSRVYLEQLVSELDNGILVSGGNAEHDGQAQLYVRLDGKDVTPRITKFAPELLSEDDPNNIFPDEEDCTGQYEDRPQLILANVTAAICMLNLYYSQCIDSSPRENSKNEAVFDITEGGRVGVFQRKSLDQIKQPSTIKI